MMKVLLDQNLLQFSDLHQFVEIKTIINPIMEHDEKDDSISDFITEITSKKKSKKKGKKKKKQKKNK